jgi:hypothetical protein
MVWLRALKFSHHPLPAPTAAKSPDGDPATSEGTQRLLAGKLMGAEGHGTANSCVKSAAAGTDIATGDATKQSDFDVTFADKPGQTGVQFLLEVNINYQGDGAFPVSRGVLGSGATVKVYEKWVENDGSSGARDTLSELAECSDRGLDNGDGECECFDGFRGLACEEQEALV